jgi:hypothetical protein
MGAAVYQARVMEDRRIKERRAAAPANSARLEGCLISSSRFKWISSLLAKRLLCPTR